MRTISSHKNIIIMCKERRLMDLACWKKMVRNQEAEPAEKTGIEVENVNGPWRACKIVCKIGFRDYRETYQSLELAESECDRTRLVCPNQKCCISKKKTNKTKHSCKWLRSFFNISKQTLTTSTWHRVLPPLEDWPGFSSSPTLNLSSPWSITPASLSYKTQPCGYLLPWFSSWFFLSSIRPLSFSLSLYPLIPSPQ